MFSCVLPLREDINRKKTFSFGHCPNEGGGGLPEFFGPFSRSAFLVNKKVEIPLKGAFINAPYTL